jgi:L-threonylcarbamoyladenylate synthase
VFHDLGGRIELVLDAGPTPGGIESTVLDVTTDPPRLLRPGPIAPSDLEVLCGAILRPTAARDRLAPPRSPGVIGRHYAPRAGIQLVAADAADRVVADLLSDGVRVGWATIAKPSIAVRSGELRLELPAEPDAYAARLYAALRSLDEAGVDRIVVDLPPDDESWLAVRDRLRRAAGTVD